MQDQPQGLCCHPYDCATALIAEEAGVIITDGPAETSTARSTSPPACRGLGYANDALRRQIEPLIRSFLASYP